MSEGEHEYIVFRGEHYCSLGGWKEDFHKSYGEDLDLARDEAKAWLGKEAINCWYQIVDLKTGAIVEENST